MPIDSQCHVSLSWYEPVDTLLQHMARSGVEQAVLIQMLGQTDNSYQQACLAQYPGRFASVVLIDPASPTAVSELRRLAMEGATGLRLRPTARSAGADPLAIWKEAANCRLAVSCVGHSAAFASPEFAQLIEAVPRLTLVLEHLGGTSQPDTDADARALRLRAFELARFSNVYLKVPGLGELLARKSPPPAQGSPFEESSVPVLDQALAAFGAERLMWGSDFPPVSSREGYGNALQWCRDALSHRSAADLEEVFGNVARRVFRLGPLPGTLPKWKEE